MAIVTNTYTRYGAIGLREALSELISDISPMDTPGLSMASRESVNQTLFEWQTDALAAAVTNNQQLEGDDIATFASVTPTVRVGNYTQIARKELIISGTLEVVSKAGRNSELAYQIPRRGREIKRDQETHLFANVGGVAGGTSTARVSASLGAWVKTNVNKEAGGGNPTYTSGVPGAARTDGTPRALTETAIFQDVAEQMWNSGADVDGATVICGPVNKAKISGFGGVATRNYDMSNVPPGPTASIAAIDVYVTDFGGLKIVPSRFSRERDAWYLNAEMLAIGVLRDYQVVDLAKTGDADKKMMLIEYGVKVKNQAGLGLAADLTTT